MQHTPLFFLFKIPAILASKELLDWWTLRREDYKWAGSWENVSYVICEQQRRRSACASAQSDQRLCCSLPRECNVSSFFNQNFKPHTSCCSWAGQFESDLVGNFRRYVFSWRGSNGFQLKCMSQVNNAWECLLPFCSENASKAEGKIESILIVQFWPLSWESSYGLVNVFYVSSVLSSIVITLLEKNWDSLCWSSSFMTKFCGFTFSCLSSGADGGLRSLWPSGLEISLLVSIVL